MHHFAKFSSTNAWECDITLLMENSRYNLNKTFRQALKQSLPIMFSYLVVGFTFGIMLSEAGFTWVHALIAGLFMYSGSLQIALVPMMALHTPIPVIAISSFLINARYMFYGIGYKERFKKQGILYPYMVCAFPDEVYGVFSSVKYPPEVDPDKCDLWTALMCHSSWIFGGILGCLIGDKITLDLRGIDFAATAMFVCIVVDQWRHANSHIPALIGLVSGLGCLWIFGADSFMLPALIVSLILMLVFRSRIEKEGDHEQ